MKKYFFGALMGLNLFVQPVLGQEFLLETEEPEPAPVVEKEVPSFNLTYKWEDFLTNKSCGEDFEQLKNLPFLSQKQQVLKDKMNAFCVEKISVWNTLLTFFRQNKKALLIDNTLKENGFLLGYVKALPYYLFDIHNHQSTGNSLIGKLDKIQNSIEQKDPNQILVFIQDLSPNEQLFFMPLYNETVSLIEFKELLESEVEDD